jgi:hypothetical protein
MDANFDARRKMFGDAALGAVNVDMIEVRPIHWFPYDPVRVVHVDP